MKILVIDDNTDHRQAAIQTLGSAHNLTVVGTHDEAIKLLSVPYDSESDPYWDAVLCDLLMPVSEDRQGSEGRKLAGTEMPIGWALAIDAALNGAKYVAVVTDKNHHDHPASALLDRMCDTVFEINGANALFTSYGGLVDIKDTNERGKNWAYTLECLIRGNANQVATEL